MISIVIALILLTTALPSFAQPSQRVTSTSAKVVPPVAKVAADSALRDSTSGRVRRQRLPRVPRPGIFTSLDSARTMPDSVVALILRGKGLTTVTGLAAFKNLQSLDLGSNALTVFPADITKLPKLLTLDLSDNPIKSIPAEIGSLTMLSRLNLRNTSISTLPPSIGKCVALSSLDVSKNPLVTLPIKELNQLPILRQFLIGGYKPDSSVEPSAEPATTPTPARQK